MKRTNLKKPSSERTGHGLRVKFNPLALLLDASLEGEFDLVQRIIYEVTADGGGVTGRRWNASVTSVQQLLAACGLETRIKPPLLPSETQRSFQLAAGF